MRKAVNELKAFRTLLETLDPESMLVCYTHLFLCETYKNTYIKLGQPPNIKLENGNELGPCGLECYIEVKQWGMYFTLGTKVKTVVETINKIAASKILRKQDSSTIGAK